MKHIKAELATLIAPTSQAARGNALAKLLADESGNITPNVIREVLDEHLPASDFVRTPIGTIMHVENHRAAVEAAKANGANGALLMLEPAAPVDATMLRPAWADEIAQKYRAGASGDHTQFTDEDKKPESASPPFWALCKSLQKRKRGLDEVHYFGCIGWLVTKFLTLDGNAEGGFLRRVLNELCHKDEHIDYCHEQARLKGDRDAMALADLLLTLTVEQRNEVLG